MLWRNSKTLETTGVVIVKQMTVSTLACFKLCMRAYDVTTNGTTSKTTKQSLCSSLLAELEMTFALQKTDIKPKKAVVRVHWNRC